MRKTTFETTFESLPLNQTSKSEEGYYVEILQKVKFLLEHTIENRSQTYLIRFDLYYPKGPSTQYQDNAKLLKFLNSLTRYCKRKKFDPRYLWAREISTTGQVHYHCMLLLNASYIQSGHGRFLDKATDLWQSALEIKDGKAKGLVHLCKNDDLFDKSGGVKIRRNDPDKNQLVAKCFERVSYIAKCSDKEEKFVKGDNFGCSRLPRTKKK